MATFRERLRAYGFSRSGLWTLFLMAAFPTHVWTLVLVMRDFSWVSQRTNIWDAFGVSAYGLLIALAESLFVLGVILVLNILVPPQWEEKRRIALLFVIILLAALWSIGDQLCFMLGIPFPAPLVDLVAGISHPVRVLYAFYFLLATLSVALPVWWVSRSKKVQAVVQAAIERLSPLSAFYLLFDVVALVIVVVRNLKGLL